MNVVSLRSRIIWTVALLALLLAATATAQDANYWTLQHGNQARLLGGAVVGGSADLSATYYNPARVARLESKELILAGNVFEYTSLSVGGAVQGKDFKSTRLAGVPSLFAGQIGSPSDEGSHWAYSLLARYNSNFRFDERRSIDGQVEYPVDQSAASFSFDESLSEYWAGLTWARAISSRVALGVTGYVAVRNQDSRSLVMAQVARDTLAGIAVQRRDFRYTHISALAKVGISADLGAWRIGVTATTPNLKIYGSSTLGFDESYVGDDLDDNGTTPAQILTGYQDGLTADYRAAASLAGGLTYDWERSSLHLTSEWFAGVDGYTVIEVEPIPSSDGSTVAKPDVNDRRDAVLNFGVGFEHRFHDELRGYASFRTDFTSTDTADASQISVSVWDIYHLGAGATFAALNTNFTLGLIYAFGSREAPPTFGIVPDSGEDDVSITEADSNIEFRYRRLTGLLGFSFGF